MNKINKNLKKARVLLKNKKTRNNFLLFVLAFFLVLGSISLFWLASIRMPSFNSFDDRKEVGSTKIYDRTGQVLLFDLNQELKRTSIPLSEMGENIQKTTIAIEDADFYKHKGIKITSIIRAALNNTLNIGKTQGGSTITQQLVKNTLLNQKRTYSRKIKEWFLAVKIERTMSKDKILEMYLNEIPYGGMLYGIEEASKSFFNKKPIDLTLAESAYLAAIPQSPTTLSPYGKNKDRLEERKNFVLLRAKEVGFITEEEYQNALKEEVSFQKRELSGIKAPHFVFFIREYLEEKYGTERVEAGGFKVVSTIDYEMQKRAEEIVKEEALKNEKEWGGSNASLVAIDPKTGQILAMAGSRDYFDKEIDGNFNVATALRQPGSSFKSIVYALAFEKGFTPDTVLFDLATEFNSGCSPYGKAISTNQKNCYMPSNYDDKHRGPMSLRNALAQSINVPAVKLLYLVGTNDAINFSKNLGITSLKDPAKYGLSLVIGGGEVSLLEMTSSYAVFANNGLRNKHTGILKIEDKNGNTLEEFIKNERSVISKNSALMLNDVLSDNQSRIPTFGANSALNIKGYDVAAKTGTTNDNRDAWTIGYSPNLTVGVWVGNNDNSPMKKGGVAMAGPIFNKFMTQTLNTLPIEKFEKPDLYFDPNKYKPALRGFWQGNENFFIDKISGKLATELTPKETKEERVLTNVHNILYWVDKNDILGPSPENPYKDSQFKNWEEPVRIWWQNNAYKYGGYYSKPTEYDNVHTEDKKIPFEIIEPNSLNSYKKDENIKLQLASTWYLPLKKADIYINGSFFESVNYPFNFSFKPELFENLSYQNEIKIILYDTQYNKGENSIIFRVE